MRRMALITALFCLACCLAGCGNERTVSTESGLESASGSKPAAHVTERSGDEETMETETDTEIEYGGAYTVDTAITGVTEDPVFGEYGRLIFPVDSGYYSGDTLGDLHLTWYSNIDPNETVAIANYLREHAAAGDTVFYDIYSEEEKAADPEKEDTGLFFFKGTPGEKFAVCNAGGGFAYVGAIQDSFSHALELSKRGYNAFALIYRPGARTACEDLARAISFIFEHAEELEVDTDGYSLWGGSAGGRMAAWLGSYGTAAFGEEELPRAGTAAEGWIDEAVSFWEAQT